MYSLKMGTQKKGNKFMAENTPHKSKIGGQALIEGVMMRGLEQVSMAVRTKEGDIYLEMIDLKKPFFLSKVPFIRGIFNLVDSLIMGYTCLGKSAEKSGLDDEEDYKPSKFEQWLNDKYGDKLAMIATVIGAILGVILSTVLFMFIPTVIVKFVDSMFALGSWKGALEGAIKIIIFTLYLAMISKMESIARVFQYHGAEHKTIFCYEKGLPLTVENVRDQPRFHPRCGTSFMVIVLILSIMIFSAVTWEDVFTRLLIKIVLTPVVIGIAYELIKIAGRHDNAFTRLISFPGMKLQNLTTQEPDDDQIEVAIKAMEAVIPENKDDDQW